ncbi:type IX secretion system protein PorQ [Salisaeta longa]|uniref:type IX secretion system protein PorQ n=1 Tax=Salisaeta longa TaxID=503170 RepID=UPI0003B60689|nr:type IX secretion system protein PorQ [Salisaeta longa]
MRYIVAWGILVLLGGHLVQAQPSGGLTGFAFLQLPSNARAAALSDAMAAAPAGGPAAFLYNPALLSARQPAAASIGYANYVSDLNAGHVAYRSALGATAVGGAVRYLHWGALEGRDRFGVPTGSFGAGDVALTLGAARRGGPHWRYGANLHVVYSYIDGNGAAAVGADVGLHYHVGPRLSTAVVVRHLGATVKSYGTKRPALPLDVRVSVSKRLAHLPLRLNLTAYDLRWAGRGLPGGTTLDHVLAHLTMGGALTLAEALTVRMGYNHRRASGLSAADGFSWAGLTGGFGLSYAGWTIDYAYAGWGVLGNAHHFTLHTAL